MARTAQHATNHAARHATTTLRRTLKQHPAGGEPCESANGNPLQTSPCTSPDADVVGVSPVPVHMWQWCAQSPFRCGRGEPRPVVDVAVPSPFPCAPVGHRDAPTGSDAELPRRSSGIWNVPTRRRDRRRELGLARPARGPAVHGSAIAHMHRITPWPRLHRDWSRPGLLISWAYGSTEPGGLPNATALVHLQCDRWVAREVSAFGGDAARVTLFGESAGAISVTPPGRPFRPSAALLEVSVTDAPAAVSGGRQATRQ